MSTPLADRIRARQGLPPRPEPTPEKRPAPVVSEWVKRNLERRGVAKVMVP